MKTATRVSRAFAAAFLLGACALLACDESFTGTVDPDRIPLTLRLDGPVEWDGRIAWGDSITLTGVALDPEGREVQGGSFDVGQVGGTGSVSAYPLDDRNVRVYGVDPGSVEVVVAFSAPSDVFDGTQISDTVRVVYGAVTIQGAGADTTITAIGDTAFFGGFALAPTGDEVPVPGFSWTVLGSGISAIPFNEGQSVRAAADAPGDARLVLSHPDCAPECADTVRISVVQEPVALEAEADSVRLASLGESAALVASAQDRNGNEIPSAALAWRLANPADSAIVGLTTAGTVTARGNALEAVAVVVGSGALADTVYVASWQAVASIEAEPDSLAFTSVGATADVGVGARDALGSAVARSFSLAVSADDQAVATVSAVSTSLVRVRAEGDGRTRIAVTSEGVTDSIHVAVQREIAAVAVTPAADTANALGDTIQLAVAATDGSGGPVPLFAGDVTWSSLDAAASVDAQGQVVAQAVGSARIVATVAGAADTAAILVRQVPATVSVDPAADTLEVGQTSALAGVVADSNDVAISGSAIVWSSSNDSIAGVDAAGLVTASAAGDVVVTASSGSVSGDAAIHVVPAVDRIEVLPTGATLDAIDDTARFTAVVYDTDGGVIAGAVSAWTVTDTDVAVVATTDDATGTADVRAVANGSTQLIAEYLGRADTVGITVSQVVTSVAVEPMSATIFVADTLRFAATAADSNGHPVDDAGFVWSSSDDAVLTVDAAGLVQGMAEGNADVTATSGTFSASASVRVDPRPASAQCAAGSGSTHAGLIGSSETWSAAGPHHLGGDAFVSGSGVVLTIEPGALVCGDGYKLTAQNGAVVHADAGGANAIVFSASDAATGWQGIVLSGAPADSSLLVNVIVEYADTGIAARQSHQARIDSATIRYAGRLGADLQSPSARIVASTIESSNGDGLSISGGAVAQDVVVRESAARGVVAPMGPAVLAGVRIEGSGEVGLEADSLDDSSVVRVVGGTSYGVRLGLQAVGAIAATEVEQDSLKGNARDTLIVTGGQTTITTIATSSLPWRVSGYNEWVAPAQLQGLPGALLSMEASATLWLDAGLNLNGSAEAPIRLTAVDSTQGWGQLNVSEGEAIVRNTLIEHLNFHAAFAGDSTQLDSVLVRKSGVVDIFGPSANHGLVIDDPIENGLVLHNGGSQNIQHLIIRNALGGNGISAPYPLASLSISNCEVTGSLYAGVELPSSSGTIDDCNLTNNGREGITNPGGTNALIANDNWWGDVGGPTGPNGDGVSGNVIVDTWLTAPTAVTGIPEWILAELDE